MYIAGDAITETGNVAYYALPANTYNIAVGKMALTLTTASAASFSEGQMQRSAILGVHNRELAVPA